MKTLEEFAQVNGQLARKRARRCGVCKLSDNILKTINTALKEHTASATTIYRWLIDPDGPKYDKVKCRITHATCRNHQVSKHYEDPS